MPFKNLFLSICLLTFDYSLAQPFADDLDHLAFEGSVTDLHGSVLEGARITARQPGTGYVRSTTSNGEGRYRLARLTPGVYQLTAEAVGFRGSICEGLRGVSGSTIRRDFQLVPSPIEAGVTIESAQSHTIDTSRTVIGSTLGAVDNDELPTINRSVLELLYSLPGVVEPAFATTALAEGDDSDRFRSSPEEAGIFSLNGGTPFSNNLTIEGLDNNDDRSARERFSPSIDAVEEVQVVANQFSAEYGRASGGRVNLRLRSGGERYHGRLYDYFRDARLNANSFQRNADPARGFRLPFTEHNPGATIGGPLIRDRLSAFLAYEYISVLDRAEIAALLPTGTNPRFPLPQPNGAILGSQTVDRDGRPVIVNGGASVGLYDLSISTPKTSHSLQSRFDLKGREKHSGYALLTMARTRDERSFPGGRRTLDTLRASGHNSFSLAGSDAIVLSERAVSETRVQYSRLSPIDKTDSLMPVVLIEIDDPRDVADGSKLPSRRGNLLTGSSNTGATSRVENRLQLQQTLTRMQGNHQVRIGGDLHFISSLYSDLEDATGTFTFSSPGDFLINKPARYRQRFGTVSSIRNRYLGVYIQDDWHPRAGMTLSAGLRWDNEASLGDMNNLGPRISLAWDPRAQGRMVFRAGFGLFYNRVLLRTLDDFTLTSGSLLVDTNLPAAQSLLNTIEFPQTMSASAPETAQVAVRESGFLRRLERGLRVPESHQAAVGFEVSLGRSSRLEVNYVLNRGAHLWREANINAPRLPVGFADFSAYLTSRDFGNAKDAVTGTRPITATGNADWVRFDLSQTSSRVIQEGAKRVVVFGLDNQSTSNATSVLRAAFAAVRLLRPDPALEQIEELQARGNSYFHGLTISVSRESHRGRLRGAYTVSRLMDDGVVNTSSALVVGDFRREISRSLLDARHRFVVSGVWQVPALPGSLSVGFTMSVTSPRPFNIGINGNDRNLDDVGTDRPRYEGKDEELEWHRPGTSTGRGVFERFSLPLIGQTGNLKRNAGRGPWQHVLNVRVSRTFRFREKVRVLPIVEVFNPLNATVFSFGAEYVDFVPTGAADFLRPTRAMKPRTMRLGLRFEF